ncbi:MAG: VCBS repeat-containing protein [Deltaproteobacteria bacterium]|nr:VCBS repeat-containing protein [Deltaproteobacteria bacterium]
MRLRKLLVPALVLVALLAAPAEARNPNFPAPIGVQTQDLSNSMYWPDDPSFPGRWDLWAWTPTAVQNNPNVSDVEKAAGIGMGLDAAFQRSTGDGNVIIAVLDSGFKWDNSDLLNKWYLNRKELPPPNRTDCVGTDPYDCNNDGVFNLSDYTTAQPGQLPSIALVADQTLLARADHGDVNHNGWLDPQDLIAIFSDGKDGFGTSVVDGNGYVDDICGWDFFWDDNDAFDDTGNGGQGYSHGNGTTSDSSEEGNNGTDDLGTCPKCSVLPVRSGDSFVGQTAAQGMAMYYAVGQGASVFQSAQITLNNNPFGQEAINYAWRHGAILVASSADETSMHQMYPANLEHTLCVDGHGYDSDNGWDDPAITTYINFSNGTNWGPHIAVSAVAGSSSQSTGRNAGIMGLIFSYAKQLGLNPPLSAPEAYQVMTMTTFDMNKPGSGQLKQFADGGSGYTDFYMGPGWDAHSGYGRPNVRAALDALHDGKIPPEVDITSPLWFDFFDPSRTPTLNITGLVDASRAANGFDYVVEAAYGLEPTDDQFHTVSTGSGTGHLDITTASLNLVGLVPNVDQAPGVDGRIYPNGGPFQFAVTLRIRATAHYGGSIGDVKGESRKTIWVHQDDDLLPGFPHKVANSGNPAAPTASGESSPKLVDLDGDGKDEIVFGSADGLIHAMHMDFTELPGFPVRVSKNPILTNHPGALIDDAGFNDAYQEIDAPPAVGDVDGDGKLDIVVATMEGEVHAVKLDGTELAGFPVKLGDDTLPLEVPDQVGKMKRAGEWTLSALPDGGNQVSQLDEVERGFFAAPVLADLDGDGKLDIVQAGLDGYVHVWNYQGHELPGFPVQVRDPQGGADGSQTLTTRGRIITTPAVGDVDGDGKPEILVGSNEVYDNNTSARAYLIKNTGASGTDWTTAYKPGWPVHLTALYGDLLPYVGRGNPDSPLIADIDGDGKPELFTHPVGTAAMAWDANGNQLLNTNSSITASNSTATSKQPVSTVIVNMGAVGDLDGDGLLEYVDGTVPLLDTLNGGHGNKRHDYDHQVTAWNAGLALQKAKAHGQPTALAAMLPAFPQLTTDYQFLTNYAIADITGDGFPEIISGNGGYLITAFDKDGHQPAGWPKLTGGWNMTTPAVGDLDGDGYLDVVTFSRNGYLWAWKTKGPANGKINWESYHHDLQNTGDYATPLVQRKGPTESPDAGSGGDTKKKGCGCGAGGAELLPFAIVSLLGLARRRRS